MRKLLNRMLLFIVVASLIPSCQLLEDCKTCTEAKETSSGITYGASASYCGAELLAKEKESVTIAGTTTYYECK